MTTINLAEKFAKFADLWSPKIVGQLNDYHVKLAKVQGEFPWHKHDETDELFMVIKGTLTIRMHGGDVTLNEGELYIVPKGVEHAPCAAEECRILLLEPAGTVNTGNAEAEGTTGTWI